MLRLDPAQTPRLLEKEASTRPPRRRLPRRPRGRVHRAGRCHRVDLLRAVQLHRTPEPHDLRTVPRHQPPDMSTIRTVRVCEPPHTHRCRLAGSRGPPGGLLRPTHLGHRSLLPRAAGRRRTSPQRRCFRSVGPHGVRTYGAAWTVYDTGILARASAGVVGFLHDRVHPPARCSGRAGAVPLGTGLAGHERLRETTLLEARRRAADGPTRVPLSHSTRLLGAQTAHRRRGWC
ncbi:hypothetical protein ABH932_007761 [Streptacidiphilus sp. MAP5-52]